MLFAIKYETNRKGLKIANNSLKNYSSAVIFRSDNTGIFFTNPIVALKVSHRLNEKNKHLTYKVYKLTKEEENEINDTEIVSTYEEYQELANQQIETAIQKLKDLKAKQFETPIDNSEEDHLI